MLHVYLKGKISEDKRWCPHHHCPKHIFAKWWTRTKCWLKALVKKNSVGRNGNCVSPWPRIVLVLIDDISYMWRSLQAPETVPSA